MSLSRAVRPVALSSGVALLGCSSASSESSGAHASPLLASMATLELPLVPDFDPEIHDYAVRCAEGSNALTLDVAAAEGIATDVVTPGATLLATSGPVSIALDEDDAAIVRTSDGKGGAGEYWIRCLPHDFPPLTIARHPENGAPTPGWYLTGNMQAATNGTFAMVLDENGTPVWYKRDTTGGALNVEVLAPNVIAYSPLTGASGFTTDDDAAYEVHHLDTGVVDSVSGAGAPADMHELTLLANGDYALLSFPIETGIDLTGLSTYGPGSTIADCQVQEVDPEGNLVWSWLASEHVDPVAESTYPLKLTIDGATVIDVFHCNSIAESPEGDLLVSARHTDAVFSISKATSKVTWKMGGAPTNKDGATILAVEGDPETTFYRQHDARFLPGGRVSLFDDHSFVTPGAARGVIYAVDPANARATFVSQAGDATVNSTAMGSFRVQSDGSSVVGWGHPSSGYASYTEVNAQGAPILDVGFATSNYSYRAIKVARSQLDVALLRRDAGG